MRIRTATRADIQALQGVIAATDLFPGDMLPDMIHGFLSDDKPSALWLTCEAGGAPVGFCYAEPEAMTEGVWNMLALAVSPERQGEGCGGAVVAQLEALLKARDARMLIADTSGAEAFAATRAFYRKAGYTEEARIRDYWREGDDKVVFRKSLRG